MAKVGGSFDMKYYMLRPISNVSPLMRALQGEIRRNEQARYDHRLHGVLLVLGGMSCSEASRLLGDSARSVQLWVRQVELEGFSALVEKPKSGRPARIGESDRAALKEILARKPADYGLDGERWDAKLFSTYLRQKRGIELGLRQCQRLIRTFKECLI